MAWQPLHVRRAKIQEGLYEGVPSHLHAPLWAWVAQRFDVRSGSGRGLKRNPMVLIGNMARLTLNASSTDAVLFSEIRRLCLVHDDTFMSVIDALLNKYGLDDPGWVGMLNEHLLIGNSAWTVAPDGVSLTRRVDPAAADAVAQVLTPQDAASDEIAEAWRKAYGREPDPSDAWDHSIKAVEALLIPIVVPTQDKPHLGHVLGQLDRQDGRWQLLLTTQQGITPMETLVGMLRLIYPNPDRHPGPERRVPTLEEAQAAVHFAVTIVQWGRARVLQRVP